MKHLFFFFYVLQNIPKKKARVHLSHPLCFLFISVKKRKYMKLFPVLYLQGFIYDFFPYQKCKKSEVAIPEGAGGTEGLF